MIPDEKDLYDSRNPVYQEDLPPEPEMFTCQNCGELKMLGEDCQCNIEEGKPIVSPEFKKRKKHG